jgi:small subunit ribosomal protein S6
MIVLRSGATPEKMQESIQKAEEVIKKNGGLIQEEIKWGKRNLAYAIKKKREGYYLLVYFQAEPSSIKPITEAYRLLDEDVLRAMILERGDGEPVKSVQAHEAR